MRVSLGQITSTQLSRRFTTMATSIDTIQEKLFSRPLPQLEPGTKVWDKELTKEIKGLQVHRFVIACKWTDLS